MIITYTRSSSYNNFEFCQQQYYITYNLGLYNASSKKADQGSAVHKVMEQLAECKKYIQDNPNSDEIIIDGLSGKLRFNRSDFLKEETLSNDNVDIINKSRINKNVYLTECKIKYGHKRYGIDIVERLLQESCEYFSTKSPEPWTGISFKECVNWAWMLLDYGTGEYDPRRRKIIKPEQHFNIPIDLEWAKYKYSLGGEEFSGDYSIKGTIDLITEVDSDTIEVIDYKTGQRKDWSSGEIKTYSKLCEDTQLMLYYYALSKIYPQYKNIMITIFFIRDGGPFTICFDQEHKEIFESRLKEHFFKVQNCIVPELCSPNQLDFKCTRLCNYYKNNWPGTNKNICATIRDSILENGIEYTTEHYKVKDFDVGYYECPGE